MARLFSSGWELRSILAEFDANTGTTPTIDTVNMRSGGACMDCNPAGATSFTTKNTATMATGNTWYFRVYIKVLSNPSSATRVLNIFQTGFSWGIILNTNGSVQAHGAASDTLTARGSPTSVLSAGWHRLEISGNWDTNVQTCRLDGTQFDSGNYGAVSGTNIQVGIKDSCTTHVLFDDLAFNDQSGAVQNSWPGDGSIVHLMPDSAGDINANTTLGGSSPAATVWQSIDEVPPDDGVTFVSIGATGTTNGFLVNLESATTKLTSVTSVTLAQVGNRVTGATTSSCNYASRLRSGANTTNGTTITLATISWFFKDDTSPRMYDSALTFYVDPADSAAWTLAKLDGVQIGMYSPSDANPNPRTTNMWLLVEYVPSAASPDVTVLVTGSAITSAYGNETVTGGAIVSPTGLSATSSVGNVNAIPGVIVLPTSNLLSSSIGNPTITGTALVTPTGRLLTSSVGNPVISASANVPVTGVGLAGSVGNPFELGTALVIPLGQSITASFGIVLISGTANVSLLGNSITASNGTVIISGTALVTPIGQQLNTNVGTVTVIAGGGITVPVVGNSITAGVGSVLVSGTSLVLPIGFSLSVNVGTVQVITSVSSLLVGNLLTLFVGSVTVVTTSPGSVVVEVTGLALSILSGTVSERSDVVVFVTGMGIGSGGGAGGGSYIFVS
jgi:hypothetical protein